MQVVYCNVFMCMSIFFLFRVAMGLAPLQCDHSVLVMLREASALFTKSDLYMRCACAHGWPLGLVAQP